MCADRANALSGEAKGGCGLLSASSTSTGGEGLAGKACLEQMPRSAPLTAIAAPKSVWGSTSALPLVRQRAGERGLAWQKELP